MIRGLFGGGGEMIFVGTIFGGGQNATLTVAGFSLNYIQIIFGNLYLYAKGQSIHLF